MKRTYLPYIDGLRAVAVLAVIAFHINPKWLAGGFTGVDMFFVISGFIVSYSIADRRYKNFGNYIADFYTRRIKRIFPALVLVVLSTALFSALFIPGSWLSAVNYTTGAFALFGLSNFILVQNDRDYFGATTEFNPYTHTWSLGIEEQFYVLFPFLFYGWVSLSTNINKKKRAFLLFGLVFIASLIASFYLSKHYPLKAYFLPYSRLWELALGAMGYQCIYYLKNKNSIASNLFHQYKNSLPLLALMLIGYGLVFTSTAHFPMPGAVPITLGTALLILSLYYQSDSHWAITALSLKPINYIGKISYSLYLWHWPIFVLFRWTYGLNNFITISIAILLTFLLASLSYVLIERTIRFNRLLRAIPNSASIALGVAFIASAYQAYAFIQKKEHRLSQSVVTQNNDRWYPAHLLSNYYSTDSEWQDCPTSSQINEIDGVTHYQLSPSCLVDLHKMHNMYAIGDSHTLAYSTLFFELAARTGSNALIYPNAGCPFIRIDYTNNDPNAITDDHSFCIQQNQKAYEQIQRAIQPNDVLFLASLRIPRIADQWGHYGWNQSFFDESAKISRRRHTNEAIELLRPLTEKGVHVVFEAPKPVFPAPAYRCSDWFNQNNPICAHGLAVEKAALEPYRQTIIDEMKYIQSQLSHVSIWDPTPILCPNDTCQAIDNERILFFDADHISAEGSQLLSPHFTHFMMPLLQSDEMIKKDVNYEKTIYFNQKPSIDPMDTNPLLRTKGLSAIENWGRWSDALIQPEVEFLFTKALRL